LTQRSPHTNRKSPSGSRRSPWAVIIFLGGGLLLLLALSWVFLSGRDRSASGFVPQVSGAPSLAVDREQIDFGEVKFNQTVTAVFNLTNVGDKTLKIIQDPIIELKEGC
jgi:hypothetical protein